MTSQAQQTLPLDAQGAMEILRAAWIWDGSAPRAYNVSRWFRRRWTSVGAGHPQLAISADSRYRLWVNGCRVGDGPVRGWPDNYRADLLDLSEWVHEGENEILVLVQFFGCGTFHVVPQRGGLTAALFEDGREVLRTDGRWEVRSAEEYPPDAPRISVQLPAMEIFDAGHIGSGAWVPAKPVDGPAPPRIGGWRDVRAPAVRSQEITAAGTARFLERNAPVASVPLLRLLHPGVFTEAVRMTRPLALAAEVEVVQPGRFAWFDAEYWDVFAQGARVDASGWTPEPGLCRVVAVYAKVFDDRVDACFGFPQGPGLDWRRPAWAPTGVDGPWVPLYEPSLVRQGDDHFWIGHPSACAEDLERRHGRWSEDLGRATASPGSFAELACQVLDLPASCPLLCCDPEADFRARRPAEGVGPGVCRLGEELPCREGCDLEVHFDLGDQMAGFVGFEIDCPAGTVIDVFLVEHIRADGVIQHTTANRNGLRYHARAGHNAFLSRQRRSGRHLFLTVRNAAGPVRLVSLRVEESCYPARCDRPFECDDPLLTAIWAAAHRTMELSMDDVFIDSLYEQTLWVGDARVEQLYALRTHDARDIALRSLRLAAESLSRAPMVLSQVPSCWENILPAWSFLWVIAVWEYFDYSGDAAALGELWPAVKRNLRGASFQLDGRGLFDAPWWNLFEWADVDNNQRIVLYNTLFFLGAVQAAANIERVVDDPECRGWLASLEDRLRFGIGTMWDESRGLYIESLHPGGEPSTRFSVHPQFLAVLYGAAPGERAERLLDRIAAPDPGLEGIASPFALQFYFEALDNAGCRARILDLLREYYAPMVEIGTTLWEALPGSRTSPAGFPTRSHCHGWSACPLDFLQRIVLGVRSVRPGLPDFTVSPEPHGLRRASGSRSTPFGPIRVDWEIDGKSLTIRVSHPPECSVQVTSNPAIAHLNLLVESEIRRRFHGTRQRPAEEAQAASGGSARHQSP